MGFDFHAFLACFIHGNAKNNVAGCLVVDPDKSIVAGYSSYAKLLRMGNFWLRHCLLAIRFFQQNLVVIFADPPREALLAQETLLTYFVRPPYNRKSKRPSKRAMEADTQLRTRFRALINCPIRLHARNMVCGPKAVVHFCCQAHIDSGLCSDRATCAKNMAQVALDTVYRRRLVEASLDEYTSVADATCQGTLMHCVHSIGVHVFEAVIQRDVAEVARVGFDAAADALALVPSHNLEQPTTSVQQQLDVITWHEKAGVRVKIVKEKVFLVLWFSCILLPFDL
jgi:hypothetical protein